MLHAAFPNHELVVRHLAWSADEVDVQPEPANFADSVTIAKGMAAFSPARCSQCHVIAGQGVNLGRI